MEKDILDKNFDIYSVNKTDSDYWVTIDGNRIPTWATITSNEEQTLVDKFEGYCVYKNEFIDKLNPDKIDSCKFWKLATKNFPLFSISGGIQAITTKDEANLVNLSFANQMGVLLPVGLAVENNRETKILEIGPGHGGFQQHLKKCYGDDNYYAIDVCPLFKHPRLYKTNGRKIPNKIPNELDVVYSMNVFQHLSKAQRTAYYKQIWIILKAGGIFVFGMFVETDINRNKPFWGTKGEDGRNYCNFFRQFTPVDTDKELLAELEYIGFKVEQLSKHDELTNYITYKCTKV